MSTRVEAAAVQAHPESVVVVLSRPRDGSFYASVIAGSAPTAGGALELAVQFDLTARQLADLAVSGQCHTSHSTITLRRLCSTWEAGQ